MRKRIMLGVFLCTFSILGIICNILSIIVFTRPSMRTDSNLILSGETFIFTFQEDNTLPADLFSVIGHFT